MPFLTRWQNVPACIAFVFLLTASRAFRTRHWAHNWRLSPFAEHVQQLIKPCNSKPPRLKLLMAFNTFVTVESSFEARCTSQADRGVSLTDYMRLPVEQYVCIQMPLNATLERMANNQFNMTVPPVRFFNLDVSPTLICDVSQTADSVKIVSEECILRGSKYVEGLNGCFHINVNTRFSWTDTPEKQAIQSKSKIFVEVDPPKPFKYFGKTILESTGTLAMSIALRQIENAFVQSLARDYERWANDANYRSARAASTPSRPTDFSLVSPPLQVHNENPDDKDVDAIDAVESSGDDDSLRGILNDEVETDDEHVEQIDIREEQLSKMSEYFEEPSLNQPSPLSDDQVTTLPEDPVVPSNDAADEQASETQLDQVSEVIGDKSISDTRLATLGDNPPSSSEIDTSSVSTAERTVQVSLPLRTTMYTPSKGNGPVLYLTDDMCLLPGAEPEVRIEVVPNNARRIFTGVDILADIESIWAVLTNYDRLQDVVPSLVKNEVLQRYSDGGARLLQVGGAKVLPGVTFKAKTVLDVRLYTETKPIPESMFQPHSSTAQPLARGVFPRPYALTLLPHRDITMQNVPNEGDFEHYHGVWRVQALPNCTYEEGLRATRLTYAVEIKPRGFLPVALIEGRIANDLKANLGAIRTYVEALQKRKSARRI